MSSSKYDVAIIGAGMSGLAAAIRLAMFDKKVIVLEKHSISGGLNSYYKRRIKETKEIVELDVGLHALTNFAKRGEKRKPLTKLLKQLRIPYDAFNLKEQSYSLIQFKSESLKFSNDFTLLETEVREKFPAEIDQFIKFIQYVRDYNEVDLNAKYIPAREVLNQYFQDELLIEMLIAPLLIYGSAWENDMDFSQFVVMFKSIYFEGFSRPDGGVRTIINTLLDRLSELGQEIRFRCEVESIESKDKEVKGIHLKGGEFIETSKVLSSAGLPETFKLLDEETGFKPEIGKLSFTESIMYFPKKDIAYENGPTIIFYNDSDKYNYARPDQLSDFSSAVFCLPNNYNNDEETNYLTARVTYMANYKKWVALMKEEYLAAKEHVLKNSYELSKKFLGPDLDLKFHDVFTPTTIKRYTQHLDGTVYGSTTKLRDGKTEVKGLYVIGTDQGFLGIIGSMLSGISMANLHCLMEES